MRLSKIQSHSWQRTYIRSHTEFIVMNLNLIVHDTLVCNNWIARWLCMKFHFFYFWTIRHTCNITECECQADGRALTSCGWNEEASCVGALVVFGISLASCLLNFDSHFITKEDGRPNCGLSGVWQLPLTSTVKWFILDVLINMRLWNVKV